jgi:uncharacterized membrane protein HdeD (DUF308 family)
MNRKRRPPPPPKSLLAGWTVQRAEMTGIGLGLVALLASAFAESHAAILICAGLLALTLACGASILLISLVDTHKRQRGDLVRPIRMFDLAMGAVLVLPPAYGLWRVWTLLGL